MSQDDKDSQSLVCVIVPTYNEAENIGLLLRAIRSVEGEHRLHVVVVDDASADGTGKIVRDEAARLGEIELIERPAKLGLGTAYIAGFRRARELGARYAVTMDADFSHDPATIPVLLGAAERRNADLVIGSRYIEGGTTRNWGLHRKILSRGANRLARSLLGFEVHDCTSGFRCYRMSLLDRIDLDGVKSDGYSALLELLHVCRGRGARLAEVPIVFRDRQKGRSKISRTEILKAMATLWRLRREIR